MSNIFFKFKQFTLFQDQCAMKVGTDGVLLGAWVNVEDCAKILDIGTGTGLIALMLAQRNADAHIDAIDIDEQCVQQAQLNVANSPFIRQIEIQHTAFQHFSNATNNKYDLIVSNPPYFQNALKSPDKSRNFARHDNTLSFSDIMAQASLLLNPKGRLAFILPHNCYQQILDEAAKVNLVVHRITNVFPLQKKPPKRILVELLKDVHAFNYIKNDLVIELSRHQYTPEFIALTDDFYLDK
ncbi:MAG: methyltransferase [Dysgonamonadaceae bacterium]|nr:methyltransferase [Dysgonamonadaceae bacterium]MDD4728036.1 methyltransferase [Dysgonamonadaceae bacterium]